MGNINNGRNLIIFGVHENSVIHSNNKTNNIYVMDDGFVQEIANTTFMQKKHIVKILLYQAKSSY